MKRLSIGLRLTLSYVAIFAGAQIVFGTVMWLSLHHHLYAIVDDTLRDRAEDLHSFLFAQKQDATVSKLQEEVSEEYAAEHSGDYLELFDESGNQIFQSARLRELGLSETLPVATEKPQFLDRKLGRKPVRFLVIRIPIREHIFAAQIGASIIEERETLRAFRRWLLVLAPFLFVLAAGVGYLLSRRALAPVDHLTQTARSIGGDSLGRRLEKLSTGDELQRLADTLNEMLERIETSFRRITEFTADASHELRTPVSLIRTEAELALRRSRSSEEYRAALEHILAESERTSRLLEQMLQLARTDSGREHLQIQELDLQSVVEEAAQAWSGVVRARERRFVCELPNGPVEAKGDAAALRRVVDIFLDNAVKYSRDGGTIRLKLRREVGCAVIAVEDDGIGIPAHEQTRIFERFYRVDKVRSRSLGGAGLGLAIAHWIVQQHRGSVTVRSTVAEGTIFEVSLPLEERTEQAAFVEKQATNSARAPLGQV